MDNRTKGKNVKEILDKMDPDKRKTAQKLRSIVKSTLPDVVETVKWGNITYLLGDENLSWIMAYKDHLDLGFFKGAELKSELLEGTGKGLRHIKVKTEKDINGKEVSRLLKEAAALN